MNYKKREGVRVDIAIGECGEIINLMDRTFGEYKRIRSKDWGGLVWLEVVKLCMVRNIPVTYVKCSNEKCEDGGHYYYSTYHRKLAQELKGRIPIKDLKL